MAQSPALNFGKYRGLTLEEVLIQDPAYFEWLRDQAGIIQAKPELAAAFRELGASTEETPLHNAMQVMFLDDEVCAALAEALYPDAWEPLRPKLRERLEAYYHLDHPDYFVGVQRDTLEGRLKDEKRYSADYRERLSVLGRETLPEDRTPYSAYGLLQQRLEASLAAITDIEGRFEHRANSLPLGEAQLALFDSGSCCGTIRIRQRVMEPGNGADIFLELEFHGSTEGLETEFEASSLEAVYVELKPSVGDEFPTILRQIGMQQRLIESSHAPGRPRSGRLYAGKPVLIAGRYTGIGASLAQVKSIFASQGITFLLLNEFCAEQPILQLEAA